MADVTVIVPTHNRQQLLPQTIHSILSQRAVSIELIVVDDGSSDGTGPWLDRAAAQDSRIKVVHHAQPHFISGARNAGIAQASGRWLAFCDDDDLWAPDKLALQLGAMRANSVRWSCTGIVDVDERLQIIGHRQATDGEVLSRLLEANEITTSSVIAELDLVREAGGFDPSLRGSEDWDMWIRLAQRSPLAAVNRPLVAYRVGTQALSMNVDHMRAGRIAISERYATLAGECGVRPAEARHERYLAKQLLRAGAGRQAASIFMRLALKHGRWRELPRVAAALIAPRLTDRLGRLRASAAIPAAWRDEAEHWLRPVRNGSRTDVRGSHAWTKAEEVGA
ncbi:glycosyltransferase family 2 protein [Afipia sp. TerB]